MQFSLTFTETLAADVLRVIMRVVQNTYFKMIHIEICLIPVRFVFICGVLLVFVFTIRVVLYSDDTFPVL